MKVSSLRERQAFGKPAPLAVSIERASRGGNEASA